MLRWVPGRGCGSIRWGHERDYHRRTRCVGSELMHFHTGKLDEAVDLVIRHHYSGRAPAAVQIVGTWTTSAAMMPDRWFQFDDLTWPPGSDPYLYRWTLAVLGRGSRCYLHRYLGSDWARDLARPPKSFLVCRIVGRLRGTDPGWHPAMARAVGPPVSGRSLPSLAGVAPPRGCWTLVFTGQVIREWGFFSRGRWIEWRRYIFAGERTVEPPR